MLFGTNFCKITILLQIKKPMLLDKKSEIKKYKLQDLSRNIAVERDLTIEPKKCLLTLAV